MRDVMSIALVGIGGYGNSYVSALLDASNQGQFRIVGAIDPAPKLCRRLNELQESGAPVFSSLDEFYATRQADLAIISTPLHWHAPQTCMALAHASHVLCEKPLCVTPRQAIEMARCRDDARKIVAIGYQWSFSGAIQQLKRDVLAGVFGKAKRIRCLVLWPRDEAYYGRNRWAGATVGADGELILDSPVNNACAHYLHNLFYLLGSRIDRSDEPARVTAELYRAHPIENYDTAALRCRTVGGAEILFLVSHACAARRGPIFQCVFEHATVDYKDGSGAAIVARLADGSTRSYGSPNDQRWEKLWATMRNIREGTPTVCGIEAAEAHTRCAWAAQQSMSEIRSFPQSLMRVEGSPGSRRRWVDGLDEVMERCYAEFRTPGELGVPWAARGREIISTSSDRQHDKVLT